LNLSFEVATRTTMPLQTPSRRKTMSVVMDSTQKNRRKSIGPAAATPGGVKARRPPRSRKSMLPRVDGSENRIPRSPGGASAPTAASRRRSLGGEKSRRVSLIPPSSATPIVKSDPRPVNDKAFQQQCIKKLLAFLLECGYRHPITMKTLARPSAKDFNNIATFLLRLVDPNFQKGTMKFEDEVAMNFKCVGYPYTISKTALVAAGSLHTWPTLLAALTWMMEHIQTKQAHMNDGLQILPLKSLQELELHSDKAFFVYLGKAYRAFMRNDGKALEELETNLADRFERDDAYLEQEMNRITDLNARVVERMHGLGGSSNE